MCSKCYATKEQMAGKAIGQSIKGFTETAKRDPYLVREVKPMEWERYIIPFAIVLVAVYVFGPAIYRGIMS